MPTNPELPREEPTRTQQAVKAVARFTSRNRELAIFVAGNASALLGVLVARLLP